MNSNTFYGRFIVYSPFSGKIETVRKSTDPYIKYFRGMKDDAK